MTIFRRPKIWEIDGPLEVDDFIYGKVYQVAVYFDSKEDADKYVAREMARSFPGPRILDWLYEKIRERNA